MYATPGRSLPLFGRPRLIDQIYGYVRHDWVHLRYPRSMLPLITPRIGHLDHRQDLGAINTNAVFNIVV